jgi:hypothetical protein
MEMDGSILYFIECSSELLSGYVKTSGIDSIVSG